MSSRNCRDYDIRSPPAWLPEAKARPRRGRMDPPILLLDLIARQGILRMPSQRCIEKCSVTLPTSWLPRNQSAR